MEKLDFIGKKIGKLDVVRQGYDDKNRLGWWCICECGREVFYVTSKLNSGKAKTCGKCGRLSIEGTTFGHLVVVKFEGYSICDTPMFRCRCECGSEVVVDRKKLIGKKVNHCGCKTSELRSMARRKDFGVSLRNRVIDSYKRNAIKKNRDMLLSDDDFINLFNGLCYYCGEPPSHTIIKKGFYGSFTYNGIDRLDNSCGYTVDNCVSCCQICNQLKKVYNHDDFLCKIKKIYNNLNLGN